MDYTEHMKNNEQHHQNNHHIKQEITNLKNQINNTKKFTHKNIDVFIEKIYQLKEQNLFNSNNYQVLSHLEDYLNYQNKKLNNFKSSLLSLIGTIFLPLGFIAGFFGINFKSMGNPGIKNGILSMNHSEKFVFGVSIALTILITLIYKYIFDIAIF